MVLFLPTELSLEKLRHRLSLFFRRLAAVVLLFFTSGFTCLHSCLTNAQRWWFISADRTREARCCSFWFVWLFRDHLIYEREKKIKNMSEFVSDPIKSLSVIDWHLTRNDEACPPRPSAQAKSEHSKCFLKLQFDPSIEEVHTLPSRILLHIFVGIVRIQKCSALTGRPYWLEQTHNALYCCCELLTAWAGSQQWRACAEESAAGRNTWHFSVMTASLLRSFSYCMHPLCADPRLPWQHQIWFGWQILSGSGARAVLANSTLLVLKKKLRPEDFVWHEVFWDAVNTDRMRHQKLFFWWCKNNKTSENKKAA